MPSSQLTVFTDMEARVHEYHQGRGSKQTYCGLHTAAGGGSGGESVAKRAHLDREESQLSLRQRYTCIH